jgi:sugar O-acyltransferase (sialic acid O-acetyltransferase NeuD family)
MRIAILGASDLGQLLAHHAGRDAGHEIVGFFDDLRPRGEVTPGGPVLGPTAEARSQHAAGSFDAVLIGVGYKHLEFRWRCYAELTDGVPKLTLIHSSCVIDPTARVGLGSVLLPGCVLDRQACVGENSLLNTGCVIAHDTSIGDNCFLGPGVCLAGFVRVERDCFLGVRTTVIDNVVLASGIQTGGGAVVTKSLTEKGVYVGMPARRL